MGFLYKLLKKLDPSLKLPLIPLLVVPKKINNIPEWETPTG